MKIEDAIDNIKESMRQTTVIINNPTAFYNSDQIVNGVENMKKNLEAKRTAIAALEKQMPKKIIEFGEDEYICPSCNGELNYTEYPNCYHCGQALKWWK